MIEVVAVIGNPRGDSRTHAIARKLAAAIAERIGGRLGEVDLAPLGPGVLDPADASAQDAVETVLAADILIAASPTYKATYSGLMKAFLDRFGTGSLAGKAALPVLLGGAPNHLLAVDVHFTPLLLELGASVPARGLFVLESDVDGFDDFSARWAETHAQRMRNVASPPGHVSRLPAPPSRSVNAASS